MTTGIKILVGLNNCLTGLDFFFLFGLKFAMPIRACKYPIMKKIYHLSSCSTCKRILNEINALSADLELQDIKTEKMTTEQLDHMKELAGTYESLFSRRAMKYKSMGLAEKDLKESDYRELILEEYTFLKRPVAIIDDEVFVGSSKKEVEKLKAALAQ